MGNAQIDLLTIVVAAILNMIVGFVWYSKWLFGTAWMKECKVDGKRDNKAILWSFLASLVLAYVLAMFESYLNVATVSDGMFIGFLAWLGFVATTQISSVIWCDGTFRGFVICTGQRLVSLLVMSGVIAA